MDGPRSGFAGKPGREGILFGYVGTGAEVFSRCAQLSSTQALAKLREGFDAWPYEKAEHGWKFHAAHRGLA